MADFYENQYWRSGGSGNGGKKQFLELAAGSNRFSEKEQRKFEVAKEVLDKYRAQKKEREQFNKAQGLGKYHKPYYETNAFKEGQRLGIGNV